MDIKRTMTAAHRLVQVIPTGTRRWRFPALAVIVATITAATMLSASHLVMAQDPPAEPPAKPTSLTGTVTHNSVTLTWDDPQDESITGYQVHRWQRGVHDQGDFQVHVDDTGNPQTSYLDTNVQSEGPATSTG